jgi:hypothetical protein
MTGSSGASSTPRRRSSYSDASAFSMEAMEGKLEKHLLQAFRPVAFGQY